MVELSVLSSCGLPAHAVLSVRCGETRRQQPLPLKAPFALPRPLGPYQFEVFDWKAWSKATKGLPKPDKHGLLKVRLTSNDGQPMSVTLRHEEELVGGCSGKPAAAHQMDLRDRATALLTSAAADGKLGTAVEAEQASPGEIGERAKASCESGEAEVLKTQIDGYLAEHELNCFMKAMFAELLVEQPSDPYSWIAQRLATAAADEAKAAGSNQSSASPQASRTASHTQHAAPEAEFKSAIAHHEHASGSAASCGINQEKSFIKRLRIVELRQKALSTIVAGISKNQLTPLLSDAVWKTNLATDMSSSQGCGDNLQKIKPSLARLRREELRMRAFRTLAGGGLTGKLKDALTQLA